MHRARAMHRGARDAPGRTFDFVTRAISRKGPPQASIMPLIVIPSVAARSAA